MVERVEKPKKRPREVCQESLQSAAARFWAKVAPANDRGCRIWTGATRRGYGQISLTGSTVGAHRLAWMLAHGPIPPGLCVCHTCDVRPCCEPMHLFLGTHADNAHDREEKGRGHQARGERNGAAKLTEADVAAIRASSESQRTVAARLGVAHSTVGAARRGEYWA